ncbi:hypothetical protein ABDJ41_06030 [Pedobacter sp. ASV1-7]|uniref:hypothetical protein n=1 Tax=Pedobacter sp. ASV1-7 TaxID=3145237 RepID=UPI0032E86F88
MKALNLKVVKLLKAETSLNCMVLLDNNQIILEISNEDFEKYMGVFVSRIHHIVETNIPQRNEDLTIIIRNKDRLLDNTIKIWKPVDRNYLVNEVC